MPMSDAQKAQLLAELDEAQAGASDNPTAGQWGIPTVEQRRAVYLAIIDHYPECAGMAKMSKTDKQSFLQKRTGTEWDLRWTPRGGSTVAITSYGKGKIMFLNMLKTEQEQILSEAGVTPEWFQPFGG